MTTYGCDCHPSARYRVQTTRTQGLTRIRYMRCDTCNHPVSVSVHLAPDGKEFPDIVLQRRTEVIEGSQSPGILEFVRNSSSEQRK